LKKDLISGTSETVFAILDETDVADYYPDAPVIIKDAFDDFCWRPPPQTEETKCLVVKTVVSVFHARDDNPTDVKSVIIEGIQEKGIPLPDDSNF